MLKSSRKKNTTFFYGTWQKADDIDSITTANTLIHMLLLHTLTRTQPEGYIFSLIFQFIFHLHKPEIFTMQRKTSNI